MPSRSLQTAVLVSLLGLTACGSSSYIRVVSINPPDATLYVDGERVGMGDRQPRRFSFGGNQRIFIQAVHPDYEPRLEIYDEARMADLVATNTDLKITLRPR